MPIETKPNNNSSSKPMYYVNPLEGKFNVTPTEGDKFSANSVSGVFKRVWTQEDAGNKGARIAPHVKLCVDLEDEDTLFRVQAKTNIFFSSSLVTYLKNVNAGETIRINTYPGSDTNITFCSVEKQDEDGNWVKGSYDALGKMEADERNEWVIETVANHPALYVKSEK